MRLHILRNVISWTLSLLTYCVIDYFHVYHDLHAVSWAQWLFLPAFFSSVVFANRGLLPGQSDGFSRGVSILGISILITLVTGYLLFTLGIWFHFAIGGQL